MRILIASTIVPFVEGGGTFIVDWLALALKERDFQVDVLKIPFDSSYPKMPEQMAALRLLDLTEAADILICIRTPSYILRHPKKRLWFIHHHRTAYDLWDSPYREIPDDAEGRAYQQCIMAADNKYLREADKLFTNSKVVSQRLKYYNDLDSEVLYPPLNHPERYQCENYGDYIFYPSRLTHHKRQHLAIESMRFTKSNVKLIIAGAAEEAQEYLILLQELITKYQLTGKVKLISQWISEEEKIQLFSNALGGIYIPVDEDSYGYPTLEAFTSQKPMITCCDSGGTLEIIEDGLNGFICAPDPKSIAEALDKLFMDKQQAKIMGKNGLEKMHSLKISWDHVISSFVS